jgi:hypothetical protein
VLGGAALAFGTVLPAEAAASGCHDGQVGLYSQSNYKGHCYGFYGANSSFNDWPGIKDNMRSMWNGGTSGMVARVWAYDNWNGSQLWAAKGGAPLLVPHPAGPFQ